MLSNKAKPNLLLSSYGFHLSFFPNLFETCITQGLQINIGASSPLLSPEREIYCMVFEGGRLYVRGMEEEESEGTW